MRRILIFLLIISYNLCFAQGGAMADLKFEQAENAFGKEDYKTTLSKLDEFDKAFGSITSKSLYLRIISQDKLFDMMLSKGVLGVTLGYTNDGVIITDVSQDGGAFKAGVKVNDVVLKLDGKKVSMAEFVEMIAIKNDGASVNLQIKRADEMIDLVVKTSIKKAEFVPKKLYAGENNYNQLAQLRKNVNAYLKNMESEGLDDKYREVYAISEKLLKYPKDKASWLSQKLLIDKAATEKSEQLEKRKTQYLSSIKVYDEKMDKYYREIAPKIDAWEYKDGIKLGMELSQLKETKKDWFKGHKKSEFGGSVYDGGYKKHTGDRFEQAEIDKDKKIDFYTFSIAKDSYAIKQDLDKTIAELRNYFGQDMILEESAFGNDVHYYVIRSPYTENRIYVLTVGTDISISKVGVKGYISRLDDSYPIDYLDRYTGVYKYGDIRYDINRVEGLSLLELKLTSADNKVSYYYLTRKKRTDEFLGRSASKKDQNFYFDDRNPFDFVFNIEDGTALLKTKTSVYKSVKEY